MSSDDRVRRRKYGPENLLPALRHFVRARNAALAQGLVSDNGGAIHSVERILDILSLSVCYPHVSHYNSLKTCPEAHRSAAAHLARTRGEKVEIEHVLPKRAFAQVICEMVKNGAVDDDILDYIRRNFRLVLLTKEERSKLDKLNRSKLRPDRLAEAGIEMRRSD